MWLVAMHGHIRTTDAGVQILHHDIPVPAHRIRHLRDGHVPQSQIHTCHMTHDLHPMGLFTPAIPECCRFVCARLTRGAKSSRAGKFADIFLKRLTFSAGCAMIIRLQSIHAPVAQLDRVSDSDSEGHRFESCRAYRRKPLANQRFARGFALPFFAGTAGLVHCLVHQSSFFHAFRHQNGLPCAASLPLPTAPRPPLRLVVRSPAHGVVHHASALQLRSTPLLHCCTPMRGSHTPLCMLVRSPAHGVDHHASALQLRSTPLLHTDAPGPRIAPQLRAAALPGMTVR